MAFWLVVYLTSDEKKTTIMKGKGNKKVALFSEEASPLEEISLAEEESIDL